MMTMMLRIVLILASVGTMTLIMRKIRKAKLQIEDGIFWVLVSIMFVVFSVFPPVADFLAHMLGIYATVNFLFLFMIFLLLMRVFAMTIRISQLETKVKELFADAQIDENRIAAEVTIFADKICVDEEIVRLRSHVEAMKEALEYEGGIGRKLDFIAQEMNREANTTLSKANDLEISSRAIDLKTAIEKVREQIQNIE